MRTVEARCVECGKLFIWVGYEDPDHAPIYIKCQFCESKNL